MYFDRDKNQDSVKPVLNPLFSDPMSQSSTLQFLSSETLDYISLFFRGNQHGQLSTHGSQSMISMSESTKDEMKYPSSTSSITFVTYDSP